MRKLVLAAGLLLGLATTPGPAHAAAELPPLPAVDWSFNGPFGAYDHAAAQRGLLVYKQICSACHAMSRMHYRNLLDLGLPEEMVRSIAADVMIMDGPNDQGEMAERPGRLSDRFRSPFPNEKAARAAMNGAYPPDLSVITKARAGGANYVHALLTGYEEEAPPGVTLGDGMHYNHWFPGHQIAMAPPLVVDDQVEYTDGTKATVEQMARDVSYFLTWAAEPEMEARKAMGVRVVLFLIVLAGFTYAVKRKVWSNLH